jgi:hypothetical protein
MSWFIEKKTYNVSILMFSVLLLNLMKGDISLHEFIFSDSMTLLLEVKGLQP